MTFLAVLFFGFVSTYFLWDIREKLVLTYERIRDMHQQNP